jgi:hypothetical protein
VFWRRSWNVFCRVGGWKTKNAAPKGGLRRSKLSDCTRLRSRVSLEASLASRRLSIRPMTERMPRGKLLALALSCQQRVSSRVVAAAAPVVRQCKNYGGRAPSCASHWSTALFQLGVNTTLATRGRDLTRWDLS